jgi:protein-S-isoprenylcysteine O-methyltransferase Ste14
MDPLYLRAFLGTLVGYALFFVLIFVPAWTLDYWQGWAFFLTLTVSTTLVTIYLALYDRPLLERRLRAGPRAERTPAQKLITAVSIPAYFATVVIMVFDHRFGWSPAVPAWLSILANVLALAGILIYFLVVRENRYAAATVEVAEGQTVVSTGPYAIVRHPMYAGAILVLVAMPLALGSWWGLLLTPLSIAWFAWRLLHEERYLCQNLSGYTAYVQQVRYRLVPSVW